jgi:pimeloyl-ACP methyl ester carboxylesterase
VNCFFAGLLIVGFAFTAALSSCVSPTASIQTDIDKFEKEHGDQIGRYQGPHRMIGYAWSGDRDKPPLLFVHGSPGSWQGWSHFLIDDDLQKQFHVLVVDRPGYGESGKGQTEPSLAKQGDDVIAALTTNLSGKPAILVGHSYGGPLIVRMAMDHPDRVAGLVIVAGSVSPALEDTHWYQYPARWVPFRWLLPDALRVCNEEIMALKDNLQEMLPRWRELKIPVAVIQGEKDDLVPPANVDFLREKMPEGTLVEVKRVPQMNHFVPWQHPELILEAIRIVKEKMTK